MSSGRAKENLSFSLKGRSERRQHLSWRAASSLWNTKVEGLGGRVSSP